MRNGSRSYLQGLVYKNVVTVTFSLHVHLVGLRARFNRCAIPRTIIKEYYWGGGGGGGPTIVAIQLKTGLLYIFPYIYLD